jgi:hypothetical protein
MGDLVLLHATKAILEGEKITIDDGKEAVPSLVDVGCAPPAGVGAHTRSPNEV